MKIENGKALFEIIECWDCKGTKKVIRYKLCPNNWKSSHRKPCPVCKKVARRGEFHATIGEYEIHCVTCDGQGTRRETSYDLMTNLGNLFPLKVYNLDRRATFNEAYIGNDSIFSVIDWGDSAILSNGQLAEKIKYTLNSQSHQPYTLISKDGTVANHIGIFRLRNGYTVKAVFAEAA